MKIEFKNIGALKHGELSLKPLNVFCGANNSGKTYAMYMVYGIMSRLNASFPISLPEIGKYAKELLAEGVCEIDAVEFYKKHASQISENLAAIVARDLDHFFNSPSTYFADAEINISLDEDKDETVRQIEAVKINRKALTSRRTENERTLRVAKVEGSRILKFSAIGEFDGSDQRAFINFIRRNLIRCLFFPKSQTIFLLPAERAGINIFQRELVAKRTAMFHQGGLALQRAEEDIGKFVARYPEPIADYIDFLNNLDVYEIEEGPFADLANELEGGVLGGRYVVENGDIMFVPAEKDNAISLHLASSTVKTYFGLWFYLRHIAADGGWLMIDEPELSLHPDNQRKVARILSRLVHRGVNVMLSTHSDYIVREFNNAIMLSKDFADRDMLMEKYQYSKENLISPCDVAAYNFHNSCMAPMEVDPSEGIIVKTFDDVINNLNKSSNEIFYALQDDACSTQNDMPEEDTDGQ
jgi:hypothetical protein